jgi:hypothetical protein
MVCITPPVIFNLRMTDLIEWIDNTNVSPLTAHNVVVTLNYTAFGFPASGAWSSFNTRQAGLVWVYFTKSPRTALVLSDPTALIVGTRNIAHVQTQYRNVTKSLALASLGTEESFGVDDDAVSTFCYGLLSHDLI